MSREIRRDIRLVQYEDRTWSATDKHLQATVKGETKEDVLQQLEPGELTDIPAVDLDELTDEELEEAVEDILADSESIERALEDVDEAELDDESDFTV